MQLIEKLTSKFNVEHTVTRTLFLSINFLNTFIARSPVNNLLIQLKALLITYQFSLVYASYVAEGFEYRLWGVNWRIYVIKKPPKKTYTTNLKVLRTIVHIYDNGDETLLYGSGVGLHFGSKKY